jgi:DNA-binding ferritin-like protein (Dps family)
MLTKREEEREWKERGRKREELGTDCIRALCNILKLLWKPKLFQNKNLEI